MREKYLVVVHMKGEDPTDPEIWRHEWTRTNNLEYAKSCRKKLCETPSSQEFLLDGFCGEDGSWKSDDWKKYEVSIIQKEEKLVAC